jgi:hypothetical protein
VKNNISKNIFISFTIISSLFTVHAYMNAKYEPPDGRILHGLGQYAALEFTDAELWNMATEYESATGNTPALYALYATLDTNHIAMFSSAAEDIMNNRPHPYLFTIGFDFFNYGRIDAQGILNGLYDRSISIIAQWIMDLKTPTWVRPGYEFGSNNSGVHSVNGFTEQEFKKIWIYIYNFFKRRNVNNVAWVWNTVNPRSFKFMEWYPGDNYVDWWGINYFTSQQISNSDLFLDSAVSHNKPVMICESCPIQNGGATNASNWISWYQPYFNKIAEYPNIKAFTYISITWENSAWPDWADSRINNSSTNSTIRTNYNNTISNSQLIHLDEYFKNTKLIPVTVNIKKSSRRTNHSFNHSTSEIDIHYRRSNDKIEFTLNKSVVIKNLFIYDLKGRLIHFFRNHNHTMNNYIIDMSSLEDGNYIVEDFTGDRAHTTLFFLRK